VRLYFIEVFGTEMPIILTVIRLIWFTGFKRSSASPATASKIIYIGKCNAFA